MAAYVRDYVAELLKRVRTLQDALGTDVMRVDRESYNILVMTLLINGVIMKAMSDFNPLITDQVWIDRLNKALDTEPGGGWPAWIVQQIPPEQLPAGATINTTVAQLAAILAALQQKT